MKKITINGKEYIPTLLVIKKRKVKAKGKEYWSYYIHVPKEIGEMLEDEESKEYGVIPILALIRPANWYHLLNWEEVGPHLKNKLPKHIKEELEWLGFIKETGHTE